MADTTRTVELNYRADISDLRKKLQEASDLTGKQAEKMVKDLDRQMKRTEKALKRTSKANANSFKAVADGAGDAERGLIGLADILERVSPEAATAARAAADLGGGLEGVIKGGGAALGALAPLGIAVGALGAAWLTANHELDKANAKIERNREEMNAQLPLIQAVREAKLLESLATEKITQAEFDQQIIAQQASDLFGERINAAREKLDELNRKQGALEQSTVKVTESNLALHNSLSGMSQGVGTAGRAVEDYTGELTSAQGELDRLEGMQRRYISAVGNTKEIERFNELLKAQETQADKVTAANQKAAAALDENIGGLGTATEDLLASLDGLDEDFAEVGTHLGEAWASALEARAQQIQQVTLGAAGDLSDAIGSVIGEGLNQQLDAVSTTQDALRDLGENATAEERQALLARLNEQKAAALTLFKAEKTAGISSALINGAIAVTQSFAQLGPIAGAIAAVGVAATTAAQVGIIASQPPPEFHTGGMVGDPSERVITARAGEGVLTAQGLSALGGAGALDALNRGQGSATRQVLELRIGPRSTERIVLDGRNAPGPARAATRSTRPRGRTNPYGAR